MNAEQNSKLSAFPFVEPDTSCNVSEGLTKREYFANNYAEISSKFLNGESGSYILNFLGLKPNEKLTYKAEIHYVQAVVKLQLMFADELLKQLSE